MIHIPLPKSLLIKLSLASFLSVKHNQLFTLLSLRFMSNPRSSTPLLRRLQKFSWSCIVLYILSCACICMTSCATLVSISAQEARLTLPCGNGFQSSDTTLPLAIRELRNDLNQLLGDSAANSTSVGVFVYSLKNKELLYARNECKAMIPASNMKLFTTVGALEYLGEDFRFTTSLFLDGIVRTNGEYVGNIIIRAAGDPSMSSFFYPDPMTLIQSWCKALDSLGIRTVLGNIVGDDSYFDDAPLGAGWSWDDIPYTYSAQIAALSFNDNKIDIVVRSADTPGKPVETEVAPTTPYVRIDNRLLTVRSDSTRSIDFYRAMHSNTIELVGAFPLDTTPTRGQRTLSVTIDNPTQFTLTLFKQALKEQGIPVFGTTMDIRQRSGSNKVSYNELRPVAHFTSPPLKEIVRVVNTHSHNLCAEMLLRTIGKEVSGKGSAEEGINAIKKLCKERGVDLEGASFADGSGLARSNIVSARQIGSLLIAAYHSKYRSSFMRSLGSPTEKGTLSGRMKGSLAEKVVRAKTGSLGGISALSGYLTSRDQEPLVFSMIFNNFTLPQSKIRAIQDAICMRLASFSRK